MVERGNDYVIAVKDNQPKLHRQIQQIAQTHRPASRHIQIETTRDRRTTRTVKVFDDIRGIDPQWTGIQSLIEVERVGTRAGKPYHQVVCYISSLRGNAQEFAQGIRGHWGIENSLHWVKDVVFEEDSSTIRQGNAPANLSIIRAIALNILRRNGHASITTARRVLSHELDKLLRLVE